VSAAPSLRARLSLGGASAFVFAFLYLPVAVLVIFSFNDARTGGSWVGFTTRWYLALAENEGVRSATWNSLYVAVISTLVAVVLGTMLSLAVDRHLFRGRGVVQQVLYLPVITPEIVTGVSLLAFFSLVLQGLNELLGLDVSEALRLGRPTVVIAHIGFRSPMERSIQWLGCVRSSLSKPSAGPSADSARPSAMRIDHWPPPSPSIVNWYVACISAPRSLR